MGKIHVKFLGSGDAFGAGGRFQTCIYVRFERRHLLIDCDASSMIAMRRFGVDPLLVDVILLTHLHGDHFGGIPFFIMDAQFVSGRKKPLVVAGPPGLEARITDTMEVLFSGSSKTGREFALEFIELPEETSTVIDRFAVTPYSVVHPSGAPSYALRVECGDKVIAYSGDTGWTDTLITAAKGADLFVCDCHSFEKGGWYHLDYHTIMEHREELSCRRLILTHMNEAMLHRIRDLDAEGAEDGKDLTL